MPCRDGTGPWWLQGGFRGCGYKATVGREAILKTLANARKHLSAEDIYISVHSEYSSIGLATVYRTLELMVNNGLVYKFDFGDGRARYELAEGGKSGGHHHHLICKKCKH